MNPKPYAIIAPFDPAGIDVLAGSDAMGFVLGAAIAAAPGSDIQAQCNRQTLDSFEDYTPQCIFAERGPHR